MTAPDTPDMPDGSDAPHRSDSRNGPHGDDQAQVTRRRFLAGLAGSSAAGVAAFWASGRNPSTESGAEPAHQAGPSPAPTTADDAPSPTNLVDPVEGSTFDGLVPAPVDQRILVLIELDGGNDGASTVAPVSQGAYYDLRPSLAVPGDQALMIDDQVGLHPSMTRLHNRQLAIVEGVGPVEGTLSHFEMVARWEAGDVAGNSSLRSGFLARLADALDTGQGAVGLSTAGHTARFNNATATTLSFTEFKQIEVLTRDDWIFPHYRQATNQFHGGPMTTTMAESWKQLNGLGAALPSGLENVDRKHPMIAESRTLGKQLMMAAELIKADIGIRVVHVQLGGFDTHKGHQNKQQRLLGEFDVAVAGFLDLMEEAGLADRVLVATSSEFGRRARENGNGLDHGAASTLLAFGPVVPGRYGEPLSFTDLDDRGNFATTMPFDVYLASLAQEWLGIEAGSVLPGDPELIGMVPVVA